MEDSDEKAYDIVMGESGAGSVPDDSVGDQAQGRSPAEGMDVGMLASIAIEYIKFGKHVAEIYSPPRVAKVASKIGLRAGFFARSDHS